MIFISILQYRTPKHKRVQTKIWEIVHWIQSIEDIDVLSEVIDRVEDTLNLLEKH